MRKTILLLVLIIFILLPYLKATETLNFSEDFSSSMENWNLESGWSVTGENSALQGTQHTFATAFVKGVANKLEFKLRIQKGGIHANIRSSSTNDGLNRYFIGLNNEGIYIQKQYQNDFQELNRGLPISLNEWHNVKIEIVQENINLFVDNNLILSAQDKDLIKEGGISFESFENSEVEIDDVKIESSISDIKNIPVEDLFPYGEHKEDIILQGRDVLVLEKGEFEQFGNIYLEDSSKLIIKDSTFKISRYQRLLNHWGIHLKDQASLLVENSRLISGEGTLFVIDAQDLATVNVKNSPTKIHLFTMFGNAKALVEDSEIVGDIGGLIGANEHADVKVINSKVGAVNLNIPNGATFETSNLRTGFFKKWNLYEDAKVSGIGYNITLINTELVKDTIGPGPFERGWPVFINSKAKVKIKDSELRKVVIELDDENAEFSNFYLEKPSNFNYKDIFLENVIVKGQWGIFIHGVSDVIVRDSDAFWTFIFDSANLTLINTHMNEFDPRNFKGRMIFDNAKWDTAAEIIDNNDFTMDGSIEIEEIGGFSWETSNVTRTYDLVGVPNSDITLRKGEEIIWQGKTDAEGHTSFNIKFEDTTFEDIWIVRDNLGNENEINFFSKTPFDIQQKIKARGPQNPPPSLYKLIVPPLVIFILIILFLTWKKYSKKSIVKRK